MNTQPERWRHAKRVAFESAGDELVVLNLRSGEYYRLRGVAGDVWMRLTAWRTRREISDALWRAYDVDRETLERDLSDLMEDLARYGLVTCGEP